MSLGEFLYVTVIISTSFVAISNEWYSQPFLFPYPELKKAYDVLSSALVYDMETLIP